MTVLFATHPAFARHDTGPGHPERPQRLQAVLDGAEAAGLGEALVDLDPRPATRADLERVHPAAFIDRIEAFCAKGGGYIFQSDHSVPDSVSGHKYDYVVKLVREYGNYPLDLGEFDIVYAGFSIHYVNDWTKVCNDVAKVLKSKGLFVFSTLNPIKLMLERIKEPPIKQKLFGIVRNTETKKLVKTYGEYIDCKYDLRLFNTDSVEVYKKKFSTIISELGASELRISKFLEPLPTLAGKEYDEAGYLDDFHAPPVLIGVLQKP